MKICKVCKIENEDQFVYCKNCGAQLEVLPPAVTAPPVAEAPPVMEVPPVAAPVVPAPPVPPPVAPVNSNPYAGVQPNPYTAPAVVNTPAPPIGLVAVEMLLPDPANPEYRSPQKVYVTPAQKAAIQYDMLKNNRKI